MSYQKTQQRKRRHARIRSRVHGTAEMPRLSVFRSNKFIYAQLINDDAGVTLAAASDVKETSGTKHERATKVGSAIADLAKKNNITRVVFDRGGFLYAGRVAALAEGARAAGLQF
ncbi:MAG: 50S ribosomal protein L18 [Candidatus Pacebacteria bacterium]|nr:50S ribosomal protein L18 [Candidatus Paceibacterota bacterium]MCD8508025.1 50S ribosomal protein L18 [Candidatus Paceibacterota bacterium]MCD8528337.1 50S ribosomal protein L18 [Candidatus Paceibacterota bacterium]MCD8563805.1 50S ribosomal protein L18 [Candidatus Paceibacterota bacterium]